MRGRIFGRRWWLGAVGAVLCLLAFLFAFEAKMAGYSSPAIRSYAQIRAAKLQPADAPRLIAQALSAPSALHHFPAEPIVLALAMIAALIPLSFDGPARDERKLQISPSFSPHLFRRPPPQL
jgi:hypothetical protein